MLKENVQLVIIILDITLHSFGHSSLNKQIRIILVYYAFYPPELSTFILVLNLKKKKKYLKKSKLNFKTDHRSN